MTPKDSGDEMRLNPPHPPSVLLVDDDKDLLQLIAMRLSASGYAVTAVESGEAALAALAVSRSREHHYLQRIKERHDKVLKRYRKLASEIDRG